MFSLNTCLGNLCVCVCWEKKLNMGPTKLLKRWWIHLNVFVGKPCNFSNRVWKHCSLSRPVAPHPSPPENPPWSCWSQFFITAVYCTLNLQHFFHPVPSPWNCLIWRKLLCKIPKYLDKKGGQRSQRSTIEAPSQKTPPQSTSWTMTFLSPRDLQYLHTDDSDRLTGVRNGLGTTPLCLQYQPKVVLFAERQQELHAAQNKAHENWSLCSDSIMNRGETWYGSLWAAAYTQPQWNALWLYHIGGLW